MTLNPLPRRDATPDRSSRETTGRLADLFGSLPRVAPPPALRDRVLAAFDASERGQLPARAPAGRLLWLRPALVGAAAAAAAVLAVGFAGGGAGSMKEAGLARASTRWVTVAEAPASASAPFRFIDDPSLPLELAAAGPLEGP